MSYCKAKIGVFDSGVGGLTVLKQLVELMPHESFLYFADSAHAPYGNLSENEIVQRAEKITTFFLEKGVKAIVVACNTATAAAIDYLRQNFDMPFIGMEPAVKPASLLSKTGNIGVLATKGTFGGKLFKEKHELYGQYINIHYAEGKGLVELAEANQIDSVETEKLLKKLIQPMLEINVDQIVLGCTHYPLFSEEIRKIAGVNVNLIDPAEAIARRTKDILIQNRLYCTKSSRYSLECYSTGRLDILHQMLNFCNLSSQHAETYQIRW
ncbi:MAG: glutamate racemase [Bacteroidales bacterium]|nr:glutamate racemase [Bacteroidales bacterium]